MENEQVTSIQEVDIKGGWVITHWNKTWDTRVPLAALQADLQAANDRITQAQADKTRIQALLDENVQAVADAEVAAQDIIDAKKAVGMP